MQRLNFPAVLERRRDGSSKQYSVETELLLPGMLGTRMLGLMEQRGSVWNSALRLKYGLGGEKKTREAHPTEGFWTDVYIL